MRANIAPRQRRRNSAGKMPESAKGRRECKVQFLTAGMRAIYPNFLSLSISLLALRLALAPSGTELAKKSAVARGRAEFSRDFLASPGGGWKFPKWLFPRAPESSRVFSKRSWRLSAGFTTAAFMTTPAWWRSNASVVRIDSRRRTRECSRGGPGFHCRDGFIVPATGRAA